MQLPCSKINKSQSFNPFPLSLILPSKLTQTYTDYSSLTYHTIWKVSRKSYNWISRYALVPLQTTYLEIFFVFKVISQNWSKLAQIIRPIKTINHPTLWKVSRKSYGRIRHKLLSENPVFYPFSLSLILSFSISLILPFSVSLILPFSNIFPFLQSPQSPLLLQSSLLRLMPQLLFSLPPCSVISISSTLVPSILQSSPYPVLLTVLHHRDCFH